MKRYSWVLVFLFLLVFSSGCIGGNGLNLSFFSLVPSGPFYTTVEDLSVKTEAVPHDVYSGKTTTLYFDVSNEGNITLSDLNVQITDPSLFTSEESLEKKIPELEPEETKSWEWELKADDVALPKDCTIRYKTEYSSQALALYDVSAITEEEFTRLQRSRRLENETNLFYYKTKSPVDIDISLSKEQPILEDMEFYLYINLRDVGTGYVEKISRGNMTLKYPNFLELESCDDLEKNNGVLTLRNDLNFINKQAKTITCKFKTKKDIGEIKTIGQFEVDIKYKYMYYDTINVRINPK